MLLSYSEVLTRDAQCQCVRLNAERGRARVFSWILLIYLDKELSLFCLGPGELENCICSLGSLLFVH